MSTTLKIKKGTPPIRDGAIPPIPFLEMSEGEYVEIALAKRYDYNMIQKRIIRFRKKHPELHFTVRTVRPDLIRVYRVAPEKR